MVSKKNILLNKLTHTTARSQIKKRKQFAATRRALSERVSPTNNTDKLIVECRRAPVIIFALTGVVLGANCYSGCIENRLYTLRVIGQFGGRT